MRTALITGGAGFIGTNTAHRLLKDGWQVVVLDNLSRAGVERNLEWLRDTHGSQVRFTIGDVRNRESIRRCVESADLVFHFAAQVAVTTSLEDPITDFDINARGTLNVLEEIRRLRVPPPLIFTSTNKVYGGLDDISMREIEWRYEPTDPVIRDLGVSERRPLDFHSPYGCSKGAADQYVVDFCRTMGIDAVVFRMSCIYGPHQFGTEDQGWVAHFLIRGLRGEPLTIYGDGKQVRDVLFVEDLVDAFTIAADRMPELRGQAFNMGGGPANRISLLDLLHLMEQMNGRKPATMFAPWRPGDQRYYVSDTTKFETATGWSRRFDAEQGIEQLQRWLVDNRIAQIAPARLGVRAEVL